MERPRLRRSKHKDVRHVHPTFTNCERLYAQKSSCLSMCLDIPFSGDEGGLNTKRSSTVCCKISNFMPNSTDIPLLFLPPPCCISAEFMKRLQSGAKFQILASSQARVGVAKTATRIAKRAKEVAPVEPLVVELSDPISPGWKLSRVMNLSRNIRFAGLAAGILRAEEPPSRILRVL